MKIVLSILIALLITTQVSAKSTNNKFDALLNDFFEKDGPGGVALVVKDGKTVYRKAFGMANLELGIKMKPDNVFRIGSITKQFTASAIMKLVEDGKINLDDDISKYIKDYPVHGHTITIEHLLTHTSGIKSYTGMKEWTQEVHKKDFTPQEMVDYFKSQPMDFTPGEKFRYNNSGYFLLGYIIEIVSGKTYADYINDNFFEPLDMGNSYYGSTTRIIKNRASGYAKKEDIYVNDDFLSMTQPYSAGSLLSTVDDLSKWYTAVMSDKIISKASRKKAHSSYTLNSGKKTGYGYGWSIGNIQGTTQVSHGGGINGFLTASIFLPKDKIFVTVFSNCTCNAPGTLANKLAAIAIGKPFEWKEISIADDVLKSYQAVYSSEDNGDRTITFSDGQLYSKLSGGEKYKIFPYANDKFFFEDSISTLHFSRGKEGHIHSVVRKSTGVDANWIRTDRPIPTITNIKVDDTLFEKYTGKYELSPSFHIKIFNEENKMFTQATGQDKVEIIAFEKHKFVLKDTDIKLTINLDENGKVNSLTLHQNGEHEAKKVE